MYFVRKKRVTLLLLSKVIFLCRHLWDSSVLWTVCLCGPSHLWEALQCVRKCDLSFLPELPGGPMMWYLTINLVVVAFSHIGVLKRFSFKCTLNKMNDKYERNLFHHSTGFYHKFYDFHHRKFTGNGLDVSAIATQIFLSVQKKMLQF